MIPKLTALARARWSARHRLGRDRRAPRPRCGGGCPRRVRNASRRLSSPRVVREDAQLDLRVVGREQHARPRRARTPRGSARPRRVRIGMFCTFGFDDERRPVAAPVWWKVGWMRPVRGFDERRQRVDVGALELREPAVGEHVRRAARAPRRAARARSRRSSSRSSSSSRPGASSFSNRIGLELLRRGDLEALAGERVDLRLERAELAPVLARRARASTASSMRTPSRSIAASTRGERQLDLVVERREPVALEALARAARASANSAHASSAAHAAAALGGQRGRRHRLRAAAGELFPGRDGAAELLRRERRRCRAAPAGSSRNAASSTSKAGSAQRDAVLREAASACACCSRDPAALAARARARAPRRARSTARAAGERHVVARSGAVAIATPAGAGGRPPGPSRPTNAIRNAAARELGTSAASAAGSRTVSIASAGAARAASAARRVGARAAELEAASLRRRLGGRAARALLRVERLEQPRELEPP